MDLQDFASQFIYAIAAVFFISSISKLIDLPKPKFLDFPMDNAFLGKINSITANKIVIFVFVIIEMLLAVSLIAFSNSDSAFRSVTLILSAILLGFFTIWTFLLFVFKSGQPCLCFGALSKKKVRFNAVIRNAILTSMTVFAIFSEPQRLSFVGLLASVVVLSVILIEEIR